MLTSRLIKKINWLINRQHRCYPIANKIENIDRVLVWACNAKQKKFLTEAQAVAHAGILPAIINRSNSLMTRQERLPEREECVEQAGDQAERI